MTVLSGSILPDGALVDVHLGWSAADAARRRAAMQPVPPPVDARALLDTGAEVTCVDPALVRGLGLPFGAAVFANIPATGGLTAGAQGRPA